jgi:hypothetical protein
VATLMKVKRIIQLLTRLDSVNNFIQRNPDLRLDTKRLIIRDEDPFAQSSYSQSVVIAGIVIGAVGVTLMLICIGKSMRVYVYTELPAELHQGP